jgi:hypothetical protein
MRCKQHPETVAVAVFQSPIGYPDRPLCAKCLTDSPGPSTRLLTVEEVQAQCWEEVGLVLADEIERYLVEVGGA